MTDDPRLGHLMTYTTFHIGVYISLVTALIGAGLFSEFNGPLIRWSIFWFLLAGVCGGVIGSSIPEHQNFESLAATKLGAWGYGWARLSFWTRAEHVAFWVGLLPPTILFLILGRAAFK
jgi:hypothetical protein